jgi:ribonucleoside-triphosphate reductase
MTGSMNVLTLNMNRFIQNAVKKATTELNLDIAESFDKVFDFICSELKEQIKLMHKYQIAFKILFKEFQDAHMLPAYEAHFIELDKQYLTIGINGIMEGLEFLNFEPTNNTDYKQHLGLLLKVIADTNRETCKKYENLKLKINTECVPSL